MRKREYKAGQGMSILLFAIWVVGLFTVIRWLIEGAIG